MLARPSDTNTCSHAGPTVYGGGGGGASGGGASGNGRQRVMDVILETGLNKAVVKSMDLNNDGWITREEILSWSAGKR